MVLLITIARLRLLITRDHARASGVPDHTLYRFRNGEDISLRPLRLLCKTAGVTLAASTVQHHSDTAELTGTAAPLQDPLFSLKTLILSAFSTHAAITREHVGIRTYKRLEAGQDLRISHLLALAQVQHAWVRGAVWEAA